MTGWSRFIKIPGTVIRNCYKVLAGDQQHMFRKKRKKSHLGWLIKHETKTFGGVL